MVVAFLKGTSMLLRAHFVLVAGSVAAIPMHSATGQVFRGLGALPGGVTSAALKVSRDGSTVVGYAGSGKGYEAFRWTEATGMVGLGDFAGGLSDGSVAFSVSANGSVVVGSGTPDSQPYLGFRWTQAAGMVSLGDSDSDPTTSSYPNDVSDDGGVVAFTGGYAGNGAGGLIGQAFRWSAATGLAPLGFLPGGDYTEANGVSADGSVIVGGGTTPGGGWHTFRWTQATGLVSLGDLAGGDEFSFAFDVSSDGAVVVGRCSTEKGRFAMRWTQAGGMVSLGDLPRGSGAESAALGVSDDGNVIVGIANFTDTFNGDHDAFIWTPSRGMRLLKDALMADYCAAELEGWRLTSAWSVSGDGRTIVGEGINPQGDAEAFMVRLDAAPCRADFNGDNVVNSQDFFDFLVAFFAGC
jgi:probable HAF family extracellular repeat protein